MLRWFPSKTQNKIFLKTKKKTERNICLKQLDIDVTSSKKIKYMSCFHSFSNLQNFIWDPFGELLTKKFQNNNFVKLFYPPTFLLMEIRPNNLSNSMHHRVIKTFIFCYFLSKNPNARYFSKKSCELVMLLQLWAKNLEGSMNWFFTYFSIHRYFIPSIDYLVLGPLGPKTSKLFRKNHLLQL